MSRACVWTLHETYRRQGLEVEELLEECVLPLRGLGGQKCNTITTHINDNARVVATKALLCQSAEDVLGLAAQPSCLSWSPFMPAFFPAAAMPSGETSTPAMRSNSGDRVMPNSPGPQYVNKVGGALGSGPWWEDGLLDVVGKRDEDGVVVLEERASREREEVVADLFVHGLLVVGNGNVGVLASNV
jgi:hypothetical protein